LHYRFRRQASSHIGSSLLWALRSFNRSALGLPAKAVCQSLHLLLHYRFRRQASSHIGSSLL
ncbi:hypothetical protein, partial [Pseudomonas sp. AU8050]|uniref:hypothetical protein n=1 Tax=Pseudomonas sp. AU8050 TaxID=2681497 RepID=UPI001C49BFF2